VLDTKRALNSLRNVPGFHVDDRIPSLDISYERVIRTNKLAVLRLKIRRPMLRTAQQMVIERRGDQDLRNA
jgi:hypothetical protein